MKFGAAIQKAIQCFHVIYDKEKKKSYYPDISGSFSQEGRQNWIQQGTRTHGSTSGLSETAALLLPPIADDP